jgi:hypothetical protein
MSLVPGGELRELTVALGANAPPLLAAGGVCEPP